MTRTLPTTGQNRIPVIDIIRGFALVGIFIANILYLGGYAFIPDLHPKTDGPFTLDSFVYFLMSMFVSEKFYTMFAFLFGAGFMLTWERNKQDPGFTKRYRRRLLLLLALGLFHGIVLWSGDILVLYALLGLLVFRFFAGKEDGSLLKWGLIFLSIPFLLNAFMLTLPLFIDFSAVKAGTAITTYPGIAPADLLDTFARGGYGDIWRMNLERLMWRQVDYLLSSYIPRVIGLFLLGMYAVRKRYFSPDANLPGVFGPKVMGLFLLALGMNLAYAYLNRFVSTHPPHLAGFLKSSLILIGAPLLCFSYIFFILTMARTGIGTALLAPLRDFGRMALTNYIGQTLICMFYFYSFGLGLFGAFGILKSLLFAAIVLFIQIAASNLWLRYFIYGPLEWLWRSLTFQQVLPMRVG